MPSNPGRKRARQVKLGVVAVAEPAVGKRGPHARGQVTKRLHADVPTATQHGAGEPRPGELRAGDDADGDSGGRRPLERRRLGLNLLRRNLVAEVAAPRVRSPTEGVHHVRTGQPKRQAHHAVLAGATAGAHRGQARDRGRRKPYLQGLAPQPRQHRRILCVRVEQFGAQPVDKQHAHRGDIALKGDSGSEARHAHRCQHRRHHVG